MLEGFTLGQYAGPHTWFFLSARGILSTSGFFAKNSRCCLSCMKEIAGMLNFLRNQSRTFWKRLRPPVPLRISFRCLPANGSVFCTMFPQWFSSAKPIKRGAHSGLEIRQASSRSLNFELQPVVRDKRLRENLFRLFKKRSGVPVAPGNVSEQELFCARLFRSLCRILRC